MTTNDFTYISPHYYWAKLHTPDDGFHSLEEVIQVSRAKKRCEVCGKPVWKLGRAGLCFTCTTGERDRTGDYELMEVQ